MTPALRLLAVNMALDPVSGGGTAVRTVELSRALAQRGAACTILTTRRGLDAQLRARLAGVRIVTLPSAGGRHRIPVAGLGRLQRSVRDCDLLLLTNHWTPINALAYWAARAAGKPYLVCPAGALPFFGRSRLLKQAYNAVVGHRIVRDAAGWIAIAPNELEHFQGYGVRPDGVTLIPNGVWPPGGSPDAAAFRRAHGLGEAPVLLFLGRLAPIKGPDLLLEAFARCRELSVWRLVLAGQDEGLSAKLRRRVEEHDLADRVHFVGFLDDAAKADALAACAAVAIPSRQEAMSLVVLEAGAAGRPVLLTDRCGFPQVTEVGGGWVVPATVEGLEAGLRAAAADGPQLAARGVALQRFVLDTYGWPRIADLHLELFRSVLGRRAAA